MKLPERQEFLDYAEGVAGQDGEVQRQILNLLASSPIAREQLAELKRDLYRVSAQVPNYRPEAAFAAEITKLSQNWVQLTYARKFSMQNFTRSREFFGLLVLLTGSLFLLLAMLAWQSLHRP